MDEPALRARLGMFAITGAENPEALAAFVFDSEIIAHGGLFAVAFPPFAKHPFRPISAPHIMAHAFPDEITRRMIRKQRQSFDGFRPCKSLTGRGQWQGQPRVSSGASAETLARERSGTSLATAA